LDRDVREAFPDDESVNEALRVIEGGETTSVAGEESSAWQNSATVATSILRVR